LIIWDEAPMCHKFTFECLNRTLQDVVVDKNNSGKLFGGKVVVFGGDFRQILPVIPRGSRSDIVHSSINVSHIWDHCQVLTLTKKICDYKMTLNHQMHKKQMNLPNGFSKLEKGGYLNPMMDLQISKYLQIC
jgi:hypothetical protein